MLSIATASRANPNLNEEQRKLEALVIISIANLVKTGLIVCPKSNQLLYKLFGGDTVDDNGYIWLESQGTEEATAGEAHATKESQTYISALVASLILNCTDFTEPQPVLSSDAGIQLLLRTLISSEDKNTRILCAEMIFHLANYHNLPTLELSELRYLTDHPVLDIRIYMTCAYILTLEWYCNNTDTKYVTREDLSWLSKPYVHNEQLLLGEMTLSTM